MSQPSPAIRFGVIMLLSGGGAFILIFVLAALDRASNPQEKRAVLPSSSAATPPSNVRQRAASLVEAQNRAGAEKIRYRFHMFLILDNSRNLRVELGEVGNDRYFHSFEVKPDHPFFSVVSKCLKDRPAELSMRKEAHETEGVEIESDWLDFKCEEAIGEDSI